MGAWTFNQSAFGGQSFGGLGGMSQEELARARAQDAQARARAQQQMFDQAFRHARTNTHLQRGRYFRIMCDRAQWAEVLGVGEGRDHPEIHESRCELI